MTKNNTLPCSNHHVARVRDLIDAMLNNEASMRLTDIQVSVLTLVQYELSRVTYHKNGTKTVKARTDWYRSDMVEYLVRCMNDALATMTRRTKEHDIFMAQERANVYNFLIQVACMDMIREHVVFESDDHRYVEWGHTFSLPTCDLDVSVVRCEENYTTKGYRLDGQHRFKSILIHDIVSAYCYALASLAREYKPQ